MKSDSILMALLLVGFALNKTMEYIKLNEEEKQRYGKALRNTSIVLWILALCGIATCLTAD